MHIIHQKDIEQLPKTAGSFIENVLKNADPQYNCIAFYGEMGAGKTTLIKEICKQIQVNEVVTSPTFAIINQYSTANGQTLFHFDFYRIKNEEEAFDFGYEDYFYSPHICLIEWPEKIENLLPERYIEVRIEILADLSRQITIQKKIKNN